MNQWVVGEDESGLKLINFLKNKLEFSSLKQIKRSLEENRCKINGVTERFATAIIHKNDHIEFKSVETDSSKRVTQKFLTDRILYEDQDLFVYNKPPGITSDGFKTDLLLIHRLDKETSGVLMFAKNEHFLKEMIALFRKQLVHKLYLAFVQGIPKKKSGRIDNYLGKKHRYEGQTLYGSVPKEKGLHAVTEWEVEKLYKTYSLIKCYPRTGRTHQIRVHLSEMKHPILGDYQYCRTFSSLFQPKRCLLHAFKIHFVHPKTKSKLLIEAPLPNDFISAMSEAT